MPHHFSVKYWRQVEWIVSYTRARPWKTSLHVLSTECSHYYIMSERRYTLDFYGLRVKASICERSTTKAEALTGARAGPHKSNKKRALATSCHWAKVATHKMMLRRQSIVNINFMLLSSEELFCIIEWNIIRLLFSYLVQIVLNKQNTYMQWNAQTHACAQTHTRTLTQTHTCIYIRTVLFNKAIALKIA